MEARAKSAAFRVEKRLSDRVNAVQEEFLYGDSGLINFKYFLNY